MPDPTEDRSDAHDWFTIVGPHGIDVVAHTSGFGSTAVVFIEQSKASPAATSHFLLALVYVGLLVMHIAGVLSYQRFKGDVLHRMGISLAKPQTQSVGGDQ